MSFEQMMQQLKADYIAGLPEKIREIESRLEARHVEALREDFHKLKGTGKTYGLPEISQLAEAVEKICIHRPAGAVEAARDGVQLLKQIYEERSLSRSLNLLEQESFLKLQRIAA
jgi:HPt (histidine-containing phosphotransfer) domain-containing protein